MTIGIAVVACLAAMAAWLAAMMTPTLRRTSSAASPVDDGRREEGGQHEGENDRASCASQTSPPRGAGLERPRLSYSTGSGWTMCLRFAPALYNAR